MDFQSRLVQLKKTWEDNYQATLDKSSLCQAHPRFREAALYSLNVGGKRLRPVMCLEMAEKKSLATEDAMALATAIECLHTYSLIHDDLPAMDNDDFRRGQPTNHKVFGEATAILAGDALLTLSFELISALGGGDHLVHYFSQKVGAAGLISGQFMDIQSAGNETAEYMTETHCKKTGYLLSASMVLPYIYKNSKADYSQIEQWGMDIGVLFQIVDDILDYTSTSQELGKTAGKDELQEKLTYVRFHGIDKAKELAVNLANELSEKRQSLAEIRDSIFFTELPFYILNRKA